MFKNLLLFYLEITSKDIAPPSLCPLQASSTTDKLLLYQPTFMCYYWLFHRYRNIDNSYIGCSYFNTITIWTDHTSLWANLFIYFYIQEFMMYMKYNSREFGYNHCWRLQREEYINIWRILTECPLWGRIIPCHEELEPCLSSIDLDYFPWLRTVEEEQQ